MTVTVHTSAGCPACMMTKRHLDKRQIAYAEAGLPEAADAIVEHQLSTAPVVTVITDAGEQLCWDGYRPDRIDALVS